MVSTSSLVGTGNTWMNQLKRIGTSDNRDRFWNQEFRVNASSTSREKPDYGALRNK